MNDVMADDTAATTDLGRSFVVDGAAGAGKSELAFQRYLTALTAAAEPEEVLLLVDDESVVTAVRRRLATLLRAEGESGLAARDAKMSWGLQQLPDRLQVHTMSSLALALVAAAPVSSGCGAGVRLTSDPDAYYRTAARALLRTLDHDDGVAPNLETLLLHLDNDLVRVEILLAAMLRRRAELQQCLRHDKPDQNRRALQGALEDAVTMTLTEVSAVIPDDVGVELLQLAALAARQLSLRGSDSPITAWRDQRALPSADAVNIRPWHGLCELLLDDANALRSEFGEEQGFPPAETADDDRERGRRVEMQSRMAILVARLDGIAGFTARLAAVREISDVRYTHLQWTVLQALLAVLPRAVRDLGRAFQALGEMDVTEVVQGAIRALQTGQAEIFGSRGLQHAVVDNMQDFSFLAMSLLERLTASWTATDGRSLLITGNAFASTRRSEGAQPALFLKVLNNGLGQCNFSLVRLTRQERTGSAIVSWINNLFAADEDPAIGEGAMPFLAADPVAGETGAVALHAIDGDEAAEGRAVVQLLTERPELLNGSIAILLADESGASTMIDALRAAGISCTSDGVDRLEQRSAIRDLHALTRALCHLADRVAWLSVLRAPWCGLTLEDLHRLAADSSEVPIWELVINEQRRSRLSEDGQQRLSRIKRVIAQSLSERGRRDFRRLVEGVWTALGGAVCIRSEFELRQTRDYFRMLERVDDGGEPDSLEALDAAVDDLRASCDPAPNGGVLVSTIRNAGRSEFDTVLLAGIAGAVTLPEDDDALRWLVRPDQFGNAQLLLAPVGGDGGGDEIDRWLASLQAQLHDNELRRLFYAGATRATRQLHVLARADYRDAIWQRPPARSVLGAMWQVLAPLLPPQPLPVVQTAGPPAATGLRRLPSSWLLPEAPQPKTWHARETHARSENMPSGDDDRQIVATVMKRTLFDIAASGRVDWAMRSLEGLENSFQQHLAMMGVSGRDVADLADRAGIAIRSTLENDRAKWFLDPGNETQASPLQLTGWLDDKLIDADIDLSFVENGVRWIIGYCFPTLDADGNRDFIDRAVEAQRQNWNDSASLARRFDPTPVRIGLYFPFSLDWREWDPESGVLSRK